jgi:hypothetical protein
LQVQQLELDLWNVISSARQSPEEADLLMVFHLLDKTLVDLDTSSQLRISADAVCQITDLFCDRTNLLFAEIQAKATDDGPVMPDDAFNRYVRRTVVVDLEQFIQPWQSSPKKVSERQHDNNSIVGDVDKEILLQVLEQEKLISPEMEYEQAISIAHYENVSAWIEEIALGISQNSLPIGLIELANILKLPMVEIWLGLLLGDFKLEQRSKFYDVNGIWISP